MAILNKATKRRSEFGNRPAPAGLGQPKVIATSYRGKNTNGLRSVSFEEVSFVLQS